MSRDTITETIIFDDGTVETHSLYRWAKEYDLSVRLIYSRYYAGLRGQALLFPTNRDVVSEEYVHKIWGGRWVFKRKQITTSKWVYKPSSTLKIS